MIGGIGNRFHRRVNTFQRKFLFPTSVHIANGIVHFYANMFTCMLYIMHLYVIKLWFKHFCFCIFNILVFFQRKSNFRVFLMEFEGQLFIREEII